MEFIELFLAFIIGAAFGALAVAFCAGILQEKRWAECVDAIRKTQERGEKYYEYMDKFS